MSTKHVLFIALKPQQVQLTAREGRLLAIVDNYFQVYQEKPLINDGISQVFQIEVDGDELAERMDGGVKKLLLWKGEANSMSKPQDKHELPIVSLVPLGQQAAKAKA